MSLTRVFHPDPLVSGAEVKLSEAAGRHVGTVLRLSTDTELRLFDGHGGEYHCRITKAKRGQVSVYVGDFVERECESPLEITLVQAVSKGQRMDYTIQKAVELGTTRISPILTERSVVRLNDARTTNKLLHWQSVIESATEQCGRTRLAILDPITSLDTWLQSQANKNECRIVLDPLADTRLSSLSVKSRITLISGPEGGLSSSEIQRICAHGAQAYRMGPRILRTETAAVAAIAVLQSLAGDY